MEAILEASSWKPGGKRDTPPPQALRETVCTNMAEETTDGAVYGPAKDWRGDLVPKKGTVVLVAGLGDDPHRGMSKCAGHKCRMVVAGMRHHVMVLC